MIFIHISGIYKIDDRILPIIIGDGLYHINELIVYFMNEYGYK